MKDAFLNFEGNFTTEDNNENLNIVEILVESKLIQIKCIKAVI